MSLTLFLGVVVFVVAVANSPVRTRIITFALDYIVYMLYKVTGNLTKTLKNPRDSTLNTDVTENASTMKCYLDNIQIAVKRFQHSIEERFKMMSPL